MSERTFRSDTIYVDIWKIFNRFFVHLEIYTLVFVSVDLVNGDIYILRLLPRRKKKAFKTDLQIEAKQLLLLKAAFWLCCR